MKFNADKWKAAMVKAIADRKSEKPTQDLNCILASIRFMRDGLQDELSENEPEKGWTAEDVDEAITKSFGELWKHIQSAEVSSTLGFASNASAAAKAAGCKASGSLFETEA